MHDYLDPINSVNMPELMDTTFAMDLLIRSKEGVRNMAIAITETASPDARALLRKQLHTGIAMHTEITELMIRKQWFHPYTLAEQHKLDVHAAQTTVQLAELPLFPGDTSRKGMFDRTPDE